MNGVSGEEIERFPDSPAGRILDGDNTGSGRGSVDKIKDFTERVEWHEICGSSELLLGCLVAEGVGWPEVANTDRLFETAARGHEW